LPVAPRLASRGCVAPEPLDPATVDAAGVLSKGLRKPGSGGPRSPRRRFLRAESLVRSVRTRPEEALRLDQAIADTVVAIATCPTARRPVELRMKLEQLRRKRGRVQWPIQLRPSGLQVESTRRRL
jgi:hypothetical protein